MSDQIKKGTPDQSIHERLTARWSPYAFNAMPIDRKTLLRCLEAARWAASSFNEQPWRFIVAEREDTERFNTMLGCLVEANQAWAKHTSVLMLGVTKKTFSKNNKPNRVCEHDLGLAVGNLTFQASLLGLYVHQMAGIDQDKCRSTYNIPDDFEPMTGIALGYPFTHEPDDAELKELYERDQKPRTRKPINEFTFVDEWANSIDDKVGKVKEDY